MDRSKEMLIAQALNEAIWLRDNCESLTHEDLLVYIESLGNYGLFSSRQISAIVNGIVNHAVISKITGKKNRTGGRLNVGTLEILRTILYNRADATTDYSLIAEAVGKGTSQGMVSKLTGVNQGTISKKMRE